MHDLLFVVLEEEVVIGITLDVNRFDTVVHKRTQCVYILFVFRRDEDTILSQPRHPGFLQVLKRIVLAGHGGKVIFLFRGIGEIINLVKYKSGGWKPLPASPQGRRRVPKDCGLSCPLSLDERVAVRLFHLWFAPPLRIALQN